MKNIRVNVQITPETNVEFARLAQKNQLSKAALMNMALLSGLKSIKMALNPEWQAYFEKMVREGKPITLPDGAIMGSEDLLDPNDPNDLRNYPDFPGLKG